MAPDKIMFMNYYAHPSSIVDDNCVIGEGTKIWHFSHIMSGSVIGSNCNLGQNVVVSPNVVLGNNVRVQNNVSIYEGVICQDDVFLGPSVVLTNVINPRSLVSRKNEFKSTLIKKGASVGANATIVCGNTIHEFAFIGAGAVVIKDVPAYALIVGNPGRQTGWMSEFGHKLKFDENSQAVCPESGQVYVLENNSVKRIK
jgi:UDP-2-acetamido-3-amino-2,3-dideoxy-glucuronate N-acetyltransferase